MESLAPGDANEFRVERWGYWEEMKLRPAFDRALGGVRYGKPDVEDQIRREFRRHVDWMRHSRKKVSDCQGEGVFCVLFADPTGGGILGVATIRNLTYDHG